MLFIESLLNLLRNFVMNNPAAENARSDWILVAGIERSGSYNNSRFSVLFFVASNTHYFMNCRKSFRSILVGTVDIRMAASSFSERVSFSLVELSFNSISCEFGYLTILASKPGYNQLRVVFILVY